MTLVGGHVLAQLTLLIILSVLGHDQVQEFGWRIGFAIGASRPSWFSGFVAPWTNPSARRRSRRWKKAATTRRVVARTAGPLSQAAVVVLPDHAGRHGRLLHLQCQRTGDRQERLRFPGDDRNLDQSGRLGVSDALQPIGGLISDKVGRRPLLLWFGVGGLFYTYVLITYLPRAQTPVVSFLLVAIGYVILTGYTSINALVKSELFPAHVRALGVGSDIRWPTRCSAAPRRWSTRH